MSPAREIAFHILKRVQGGGYASDLLRKDTAALDPRDARLTEAIVFGCLRFQAQLDFLIAYISGRPPSGLERKLDEEVRIALRMGIYQLRYLERIPAHAAVAESVELVKLARKRSAAGFANAVLRKAALGKAVLGKVDRGPVAWPDRATELSIPAWMLARWTAQYGADAAIQIAAAALQEPQRDPEDAINPATGRRQDSGSQSIVPLLDIHPGMTVLDLCAAPGNKTAQAIAAGARVVASDRSLARLSEVPAEAMRVVLDGGAPLPFAVKFDRILVDAPCSGTGTLSRNPEIKWRIRPQDIDRFPPIQRSLLERALPHLKPQGLLVYSTCSLEHEENEDVAAGFPVVRTHLRLPGRDPGDGFFAAVISPL